MFAFETVDHQGRQPLRWFPGIKMDPDSWYWLTGVIPSPWAWAGFTDSQLINKIRQKQSDVTLETGYVLRLPS